jgi:signal transduction histidine kinase
MHFLLATLKRNADEGQPVEPAIERIRASLGRSRARVDGALDFARSGGPATHKIANLRMTLDHLRDEIRAESPGVELVFEGVDGELAVACPSGVLMSILSNPVRNSVKYMEGERSQRVRIGALRKGDDVRVEVEDSGPGISPELAPHVLEPYVRSKDHPKPGLGLGLATVKRFVEEHGGRVGVTSTPGEGSLFWFELPCARESALS